MANTINLNLPLIDDNMVADVPRDMNALAQAVDAGVTAHKADTAAHGIGNKAALVTIDKTTIVAAINEAFQSGNERKAEVVAALVAKGLPATTSETWAQLIAKLTTIVKATGNAVLADVLAGKTFSNATSNGLTGNMPNRSGTYQGPVPHNASPTVGIVDILPLKGYWDGATYAGISDPDFIAANFPATKNVFGLQGTMPVHEGAGGPGNSPALAIDGQSTTQRLYLKPQKGYWDGVGAYTYWDDPDFIPANIKAGVDIFGVVGTLSEGKKQATGSLGSVPGTAVSVAGISFNPSLVLIQYQTTVWNTVILFSANHPFAVSGGMPSLAGVYFIISTGGANAYQITRHNTADSCGNVTGNSFVWNLPVSKTNVKWLAIE